MTAHELKYAPLMLHRVVEVRRVTLPELHPVRAVRLLARDVGLLLGLAGGGLATGLVVSPGVDLVGAVPWVPAREVPARILGVLELRINDHWAIGEMLDVLL